MGLQGGVTYFGGKFMPGVYAGLRPCTPSRPPSILFIHSRMDRHMERFVKFQETGERLLPPPPIYDLDPVIPPYAKFGQEGHLYVVKPPGQDVDEFHFKIGSTTQLLKRMYWYEPGTELMYSIHVSKDLRILEKKWIQAIKRDPRFTLIKGREYFHGPWEEAVNLLHIP